MTIDNQSHLSLSYIRHELYTPINAIIGYSEMIVEEYEEYEHINSNGEYLQELEEIRQCGAKLLVSINDFLNPVTLPKNQQEFDHVITNPKLKTELKTLTLLVISNCRQLISTLETEFVTDVEKIDLAANKLLQEAEDLLKFHSKQGNLSTKKETLSQETCFSEAQKQNLSIKTNEKYS